MPVLVAESDGHPTGGQEVAGLIRGSGSILSLRLIVKIFSTVIHSLPLIQEVQLSVSGERMCISTGLLGFVCFLFLFVSGKGCGL